MLGGLTFYLTLPGGITIFLGFSAKKTRLSHLEILNLQMGFCPEQEFSTNINFFCINKYYNLNKDSKNGPT